MKSQCPICGSDKKTEKEKLDKNMCLGCGYVFEWDPKLDELQTQQFIAHTNQLPPTLANA